MFRTLGSLLLVALLTEPALATTWVVGPTSGPGVDFTSISAAVSAALPGDVILVHAGSYGGFTLSSGVQVLGQPGVQVTGPITIFGVAPGPRATIASLDARAILVSACGASVLIEDVTAHPTGAEAQALGFHAAIAVDASIDVRLRHVEAGCIASAGFAEPALRVQSSRVEVSQSFLTGAQGIHDLPVHAGDGGDGVDVLGASVVHVSSSDVQGGAGGIQEEVKLPWSGGNGGHGIHVEDASAELLVTGVAANLVQGGHGGIAVVQITCFLDGHPGSGVAVASGATARLSGATFRGATADCPAFDAPDVVGPFTTPVPADPSLIVGGTIAQGQPVTYTLRGAPGSAARLRIGRQATVQMLPGVFEDRLIVPLRTYDLGNLPPSGLGSFSIVLPASLPKGYLLVAQASTITSTGDVTLTQSAPISLR